MKAGNVIGDPTLVGILAVATTVLAAVLVPQMPAQMTDAPRNGLGVKRLKPFTVCEVLADRKKLNGKAVAVVGRLDCSWSLIDHTCHLTEDNCKHPLMADGFAWPTKILIADYWEEGMPKPPTDDPPTDSAAVSQKISILRTTTTLAFRKEPGFRIEGGMLKFNEMVEVKDEWAVVYGEL